MSAIVVGRIGEYLAAAILEMHQYQTVICQQAGFDLIATRGQKMWRCQVKASSYHSDRPNRMQWHFGIGGNKRIPTITDYDFVACVSVPHRRAFFIPIENLKQVTMSRNGDFFDDPKLESTTLQETMEILNERITKSETMHI
jgi:hypothetical protein